MKKIYLLAFSLIGLLSNAQLSLTKTFNDPVYGDQFNRNEYDSAGVIPKNTGVGQLWDFSSVTQNTVSLNTTFTTVATAPNGSSYVGATIVEMDGAGSNTYYKSTATTYELVGAENAVISFNYSNTAVAWAWPTTYGYTNSDTYSGTTSASGNTGVSSGSVFTTASGTGTLILPGGLSLSNVLQLTIVNSFTLDYTPLPFVISVKATDYNYFHSSQKMPVLTVNYSSSIVNGSPSSQAAIRVNNFVLTGLNDFNFDASFNMYPNPAKDYIHVRLQNKENATCTMEFLNSIGQIAKSIKLGNDDEIMSNIVISGLNSGIYMVKTTLGDKVSVRKLIVE